MMKSILAATVAVLFSVLLALPTLAADQKAAAPPQPKQQLSQPKAPESEGRKMQRNYQQKREKARQHRDEMLKVREKAVQSQG